jgi:hypothetical protein
MELEADGDDEMIRERIIGITSSFILMIHCTSSEASRPLSIARSGRLPGTARPAIARPGSI